METSAKTATNVNEIFYEIGESLSYCLLWGWFLEWKYVHSSYIDPHFLPHTFIIFSLFVRKLWLGANIVSIPIAAKRLLQGQAAQNPQAGMILSQRPNERVVSSASCCSWSIVSPGWDRRRGIGQTILEARHDRVADDDDILLSLPCLSFSFSFMRLSCKCIY
jgi:hypothetical protein